MPERKEPLTELLQQAARGERAALDRIFALLYPDLRRIAHARLRVQDRGARFETTALVHESFLRFVEASELVLADRKHFFAYAAKTMRNIVIDSAREQLAQRRGGGRAAVRLDTALAGSLAAAEGEASLLAVDDALRALEALDPSLAQIVRCATSPVTARRRSPNSPSSPSAPCGGNGRRPAPSCWPRCRHECAVTVFAPPFRM